MSEPPIERWLTEEQFTGRVQFPFLDEFIAKNVDIHFETMSDTTFWMLIKCRETGREWHLNCGAINSRAKGYSIVEEDTIAGAPYVTTPDPCSHGVDPARCVEHRVTGDLFAATDEEQAHE